MDKFKDQNRCFKVDESCHGKRLDVFLSRVVAEKSRSYLQNLIREGKVMVDGAKVKPNYIVKEGQNINILIPPPENTSPKPENIDLDIIYEDKDIAVINKPKGMVIHPAPGNYSGTLVNALLYHYDQLSHVNDEIRPGIVHRLDKDTSGLVVIAKNDYSHKHLAHQIASKTALRIYWAVVENNVMNDQGIIKAPIKRHPIRRKKMGVSQGVGSREATTHFRVLERFGGFTLIEARLETGRTHQIRVHMSHILHPIVGDSLYGSKRQKFGLSGQALHAIRLGLVHPRTGEFMEFEAPLPEYFNKLLLKLRD